MLKEVILRQKEEKELFQKKKFIERTSLVSSKKLLKNDLIKVVIGPRRAGKSVFCFMLLNGQSFSYLNFDDEGLIDLKLDNYDSIIKELENVYGKTDFLFFDEIQNLKNWEIFVNRLHRSGYNLVLTGSNANLLSKELASSLTGRHSVIEVLPFNFKEFSLARTTSDKSFNDLVQEFLLIGGFPEVVVKDLDVGGYLDVLFDSILFKDIVKRYNIRFPQKINDLGNYLLDNHSGLYSFRKLIKDLDFKSLTTVERYVRYLSDAYLIFSVNRLSFKSSERIKSPRKIYSVDNGLIKAKSVKHSPDWGRLMENMVFLELIKKGLKPNLNIFYGKTKKNGKEIDFIIKSGNQVTSLIQIAYEINIKNKNREVSALVEAGSEFNCNDLKVITLNQNDAIKIDDLDIKIISIDRWLSEC